MTKGTGDHLHDVIREWTGAEMSSGCRCGLWTRAMNRRGVQWCINHRDMIVTKLRREAAKRKWWRFLAGIPGVEYPLQRMVQAAINRSLTDHARDGNRRRKYAK